MLENHSHLAFRLLQLDTPTARCHIPAMPALMSEVGQSIGGPNIAFVRVDVMPRTGVSIMRTQSLASLLMRGQGSDWKSSCPFRMASKICCSVSPQNGGTPDNRMYRMTPALQMSASWPYFRLST